MEWTPGSMHVINNTNGRHGKAKIRQRSFSKAEVFICELLGYCAAGPENNLTKFSWKNNVLVLDSVRDGQ
jgi:hypothetical protein